MKVIISMMIFAVIGDQILGEKRVMCISVMMWLRTVTATPVWKLQ